MLKFLRTMSIKNKVKFLSFFPLLFIISLSLYINYGFFEKESKMSQLKEVASLNAKISLLVHELQIERGSSSGFLSSKGEKFKDVLLAQREATNKSFLSIIEYSMFLVSGIERIKLLLFSILYSSIINL